MSYENYYKATQEWAKEICEDEKNQKIANDIAASVVGISVGAATGNPIAGKMAKSATSAFTKPYQKEIAEVTTVIGIDIAVAAASIIATPIVVGALLLSAIGSLFDD